MNARSLFKTREAQIALVVLLAALVTFVWSLSRALRGEPLPPPPPLSVASLDPIMRRPPASPADVQSAVENDLFSSDRSAPSSPYRMPGESAPNDKPVVEPMKPVVLGTAVANDGRSFATLQLGDSRPTLVHVGDKIGEWTVKAIDRGKVVLLSTTGSRAELAVPKPGT